MKRPVCVTFYCTYSTHCQLYFQQNSLCRQFFKPDTQNSFLILLPKDCASFDDRPAAFFILEPLILIMARAFFPVSLIYKKI